ncbi:MAG: hypothetical protein ACOWWH_07250 [Eubacteriaceae bacterium]
MKILKIYFFPVLITLSHIFLDTEFIKNYWITYIVGFILLSYSYISCNDCDHKEIILRRFYFVYVYFLLLFISPQLNKYSFNQQIFGLSMINTTYLILIICSSIIYLFVISDFNVSELSIGNTKITMLKKNYAEAIENNENLTNILLGKIKIENELMQDFQSHCRRILKNAQNTKSDIVINNEYLRILKKYFRHENDVIEFKILDKLDRKQIKSNLGMTRIEFYYLKNVMGKNELYGSKNMDSYYLIIPFKYIFEEKDSIYILLESKTPIIIDVEGIIIPNLLRKFTDDFLGQALDINQENYYNI